MNDCDSDTFLLRTSLLPGDFYVEDGRVVFTAAYHSSRGFCCESGCRHCPFNGRVDRPTDDVSPPPPASPDV